MARRKKEISKVNNIEIDGRVLIAVSVKEHTFDTYIGPGSNGEEVVQALAATIHTLTEREKTFNSDFTSDILIRSIEVWLKNIEDHR